MAQIEKQVFTKDNWPKINFSYAELSDKATGECVFAPEFVDRLQDLRQRFRKPMIVTSGCRSPETMERLKSGGYPVSSHSFHMIDNAKYGVSACAVDIKRPPGPLLHQFISLATFLEWSVGIAKTFVHIDQRAYYAKLPATIYTYF